MMRYKILTAFLLLTVMLGCSMIPAYQRPDSPVAVTWPEQTPDPDTQVGFAAEIAWKDYIQSEVLHDLIERVLENNRDLRIAALNIEQAQATYRIQRTALLPTIAANGKAARTGVPDDVSSTGRGYTATSLNANVALAAYELDFFGRVSSLNQAALEAYLATEEAWVSARISLIAETANAYLSLLADQKLLQLSKDNHSSQVETYQVVKLQFDVGSVTRLDVAQAATAVENARVAIARYSRRVAQDRNALIYLAGDDIGDLLSQEETIDTVQMIENLPAGLPSALLLQRPDIRQAEHVLKSANADIGAARAALYPSISLTGAFGLASDSLDGLVKSGAMYAWNFSPSLTVPIFNRGKLKASLEVAEVNEKIAATQYEQAIQTAFREVADQLAARRTYQFQLDAQDALVSTTNEAYELSKTRYDNGVDNFLIVLDSQRSLFAAQQEAISVKQAYLANLVSLYKVLGGGQL
ncbi:efflux transporter outer membrane subunit [uncultured Desulfuromusa sp.]|uniref:efflux transporter outer membrane subunit n=1 Tax=uncultured Desulfuromusa sp. TaxID=219183 RepID=UPI002AA69381|nr:efflux transporter outer membrane subunit [uncultured Desulfuromusa sp.]